MTASSLRLLYEPARMPGVESVVDKGSAHWYTNIRPRLQLHMAPGSRHSSELPLECTQEPGDLLYLPEVRLHVPL